jgi:hypothetical protein
VIRWSRSYGRIVWSEKIADLFGIDQQVSHRFAVVASWQVSEGIGEGEFHLSAGQRRRWMTVTKSFRINFPGTFSAARKVPEGNFYYMLHYLGG